MQWGSQKRTSNDHGLIGHTPMTDALREKPINIVVDPRKPKAAGPVDIWLPLRPATDAAMALGWMNVIFNEELYDKDFVQYCHGFEELRKRAQDYPISKVADITWCDPETIAHAARPRHDAAGCRWGTAPTNSETIFQATRSLLILMGWTGNLDARRQCILPRTEAELLRALGQVAGRAGCKTTWACRLGDQHDALRLRSPASALSTILSDAVSAAAHIVVGNNTVTCFPNTQRIIDA